MPYYDCYRKSKTGQQYSLILNRNRLDTSCAEDDDYLTVEDYDIHDGDSNIVINHGIYSIFMPCHYA